MKNWLAKIHIAKKALALDDDTYRAMLQSVAGVSSSKDLDAAGAQKVLDHCKRCGWKPTPPRNKGRKPDAPKASAAIMRKLEALLTDASRPWSYADAMAKRMFKIERVQWCDDAQASKIMQALIYDAKRTNRDR
ncbi:gp16 family protein [Craterilacuibacter sinensis]|nr:regulatory protein GemA [Craterilacuibacter sinensis]